MILLASVNSTIFIFLSALHVYWASGGTWASLVAVPDKKAGEGKVFQPGIIPTLVVASGLFLFALLTMGNFGLFDSLIDRTYIAGGMLVIGIIFLLRVVGDFNYVGLFKKVNSTTFAFYDNRIYIPLCAIVAINSVLLYYLK